MHRILSFLGLTFLLVVSCSKDKMLLPSLTERISYKWNWLTHKVEKLDSQNNIISTESLVMPVDSYILLEKSGNIEFTDGSTVYTAQWQVINNSSFVMTYNTVFKVAQLTENDLVIYFETEMQGEKYRHTYICLK